MSDKRVDTIVRDTDAGREGELIFRLVYEKCKCKKPVKRLWVSSLEDEAIRKGFENLKSSKCYDDLYRSALCRERADWLIGMNATRYFTVKNGNKGVISIGRVQTPTLALIVSRDREIQNFVKKKYYTVEINCGEFTATSERIDDTNTAEELYRKCKIAKAVVKNITKEDKSISPPKLYDLTALQRDANRIYGFTSQQTLDTVQKLYEDKLVTYPRTDSRYLTEDMLQPASEIINIVVDKLHLNTYTPNIETVMDNSKVSDHHAIIPTANISDIEIDTIEDKSQKILLLLMKRLVSATSDKYRYKNTVVLLECCGADFKATGKTVTNKGFKAIENTPDEDNNESYIPNVSENSEYSVVSKLCEHYTQPPNPYTEDTLLSAMEKAGSKDYTSDDIERKGLGTPATRAGIIEVLLKRGYIERKGKNLVSTDKGAKVVFSVPEVLRSAKMTAEWENELSLVSKGKADSIVFMAKIENFVKDIVNEVI